MVIFDENQVCLFMAVVIGVSQAGFRPSCCCCCSDFGCRPRRVADYYSRDHLLLYDFSSLVTPAHQRIRTREYLDKMSSVYPGFEAESAAEMSCQLSLRVSGKLQSSCL